MDVNELNEKKQHIKNVLESALNPEMEKLSRGYYEKEDNVTCDKNEGIVFSFDVLNKMLSKMKKIYSKKSKDTGFENGKKIKYQTYKKYYEGEYDITELIEIMYEVIISIFINEPDGNGCVTFNGKKNKDVPIIDGVSLLKNISYFCCYEANERQRIRHNDISEIEDREDGSRSEDISVYDGYSFEKWQHEEAEKWNNQGEILRLLVYADILEWLRKHNANSLFKRDSYEVHAIIDTILANEKVFENEIDECLKMVKQKELQRLIYEQTGKRIELTNISTDIKLIEQRIINHLFYSMNYKVGDDKKEQTQSKINNGYLQELDNKRYFKLFGRESMFIYKICSLCLDDMNAEKFLEHIREHDDAVIPKILSLVKGRRKYDMINLIRCDLDVIDDDISYEQIVIDIAQTLVRHYQEAEDVKITELKKQYKFSDRFTSGKSQMWEADLLEDCLRIRFWADENTKHSVNHKINRDNLLIYEGYDNFYFCDESEMVCFLVPKGKRVITKSDSLHNIFFSKIA